MAASRHAEIDGWDVFVREANPHVARRYKAVAIDEIYQRYAEAYGVTPADALRQVSEKTGLDFDTMISKLLR